MTRKLAVCALVFLPFIPGSMSRSGEPLLSIEWTEIETTWKLDGAKSLIPPGRTTCQLPEFYGIDLIPVGADCSVTDTTASTLVVRLRHPLKPRKTRSKHLPVIMERAMRSRGSIHYVPPGRYRLQIATIDCPDEETLAAGEVTVRIEQSPMFKVLRHTHYQ